MAICMNFVYSKTVSGKAGYKGHVNLVSSLK